MSIGFSAEGLFPDAANPAQEPIDFAGDVGCLQYFARFLAQVPWMCSLLVDRLRNKPRVCFTECKCTEPLQSRDCRRWWKGEMFHPLTLKTVWNESRLVSRTLYHLATWRCTKKNNCDLRHKSHSLIDHRNKSRSFLFFVVDVAKGSLDCPNAEAKTAADMVMGRVGFH